MTTGDASERGFQQAGTMNATASSVLLFDLEAVRLLPLGNPC